MDHYYCASGQTEHFPSQIEAGEQTKCAVAANAAARYAGDDSPMHLTKREQDLVELRVGN